MNKKDFINKTFITNSPEETQKLGCDFARTLLAGSQGESLLNVIALYGDLGSGKTTFTQGLAKGLGIKGRIISPTFIIVRQYNLKSQISKLKTTSVNLKSFCHVDLYRIEVERDLEGLGIEEILNNENNFIVIEWAEKLKNYLPKKRIDIKFSYEKDDSRGITFRSSNQ
jgi:tRNA threonylcarbamoyladenosine biosynthesis protein TsaE